MQDCYILFAQAFAKSLSAAENIVSKNIHVMECKPATFCLHKHLPNHENVTSSISYLIQCLF